MKRPLALALLAAAPAAAQGPAAPNLPKALDCYCTDSTGGRVELGESICLTVDGRSFTAQCQMSLNVPMWREIGQGCLNSALSRPLPQQG